MAKFWNKKSRDGIKLFISIGAGLNQIPLIREARDLGLHVIGVDHNPSAPGFVYCDLKIQESIENQDEIYTKLLELLVDGDIVGIMTKSYGTAIKTAAFLSEKFKIPYIPLQGCDNFINKSLMKPVFIKNSIPTPKQYSSIDIQMAINGQGRIFPLICKPAIGHAKIDVNLVKNSRELKKCMASEHKYNGSMLIEEYIDGNEIIAIGLANKGRYYLVDITDKERTSLPHFVDLMHISPSRYSHLFNKIQDLGQSVIDAFSITTSPLIMEFLVTPDDNLFLIEAVPEFGGEFLSDILVPARTGYNFISEAIKAVTRSGFSAPMEKMNRDAVVVKYITGGPGTLASCNPQGPKKYKNLIFSRIFKEIGSQIREPENNLDRIGVVVVKGKTVAQAIETAENVVGSFNIRIKQ